jgi:hypothetical protein
MSVPPSRDDVIAIRLTDVPDHTTSMVSPRVFMCLVELAAGVDERAVVVAAARRSIRDYGGGAYRAKPLAGPPTILVG